jgi:hypothetical protein
MSVISEEVDPNQWRQMGWRVHPEVRKALRARAVLSGKTIEDTVHRIFVDELRKWDLLPADFEQGR